MPLWIEFVTAPAASSDKRNVTVWHPSVWQSLCLSNEFCVEILSSRQIRTLLRQCCPKRQHCRSNCCFDNVASTLLLVWTGPKQHCRTLQVERFFRQCRRLLRHCCRFRQQCCRFRQQCRTKFCPFDNVERIEHVRFVSTLSKGLNLVRHCCRKRQHCCQKRQQCRSNIRLCRKDEILQ